MKLLKLRLQNFKGVREFTLDAQGRNVNVFGDNATGKTTLFDAFTWLLFGKDSSNKSDFELKTLNKDGEVHHGLDHEVEAELEINGGTLALRKVYREKWTKKRGSALSEFTGHTTDHYVDGVPVKKNEYDGTIADIAEEGVFKLLTSPSYFNEQLHWQERRKLLLDVCGDISDAEVIASNKELSKLADVLKGRSLENHRKIVIARRSEINRELERIPVRIDEVERALPNVSHVELDQLDADLERHLTELQELEQQLARAESGGEAAEVRKKLREVEADLLDLQSRHRRRIEQLIGVKRRELNGIITSAQLLERDDSRIGQKMSDTNHAIQQLTLTNEKLRDEWNGVATSELVFEPEEDCPTCGQAIPYHQLEAAREKALSDYNRKRAQQLEDISQRGKSNNTRIGELQSEVEELDRKRAVARAELGQLSKQADALQAEVDELESSAPDFGSNPEYTQKLKDKATLEARLTQITEDQRSVVNSLLDQAKQARTDVQALEATKLQLRQHEQGQARVRELMEQERRLAAEYEQLEQSLYLTELFVKTKVSLLEERINSKFHLARFTLFDQQVNGGLVETCETLFSGVPYSGGLNNAAKINVGLDIISTLSEHYGFTAPIFIDNREAVTKLIELDAQVISLVVSEKDKTLRTEVI